jgi:hypothetical protein
MKGRLDRFMGLDKILENHICLCGEKLPGGVVDFAAEDSTQMTENSGSVPSAVALRPDPSGAWNFGRHG